MGNLNDALKETLEHDPLFVKRELEDMPQEKMSPPEEIAHKCPMCNKIRVFRPVMNIDEELAGQVSEGAAEILHYTYQCGSCGTTVDFGIEFNRDEKWVKKVQNSITFEVRDF